MNCQTCSEDDREKGGSGINVLVAAVAFTVGSMVGAWCAAVQFIDYRNEAVGKAWDCGFRAGRMVEGPMRRLDEQGQPIP